MDLDKEQIKSRVLEKMCRGKYFGGCHVSVDDLKSGFPSHLRGEIPGIVDEMIKEELSVDLFWI